VTLSHTPFCVVSPKEKEKKKKRKVNINNNLAILPSHDRTLSSSLCQMLIKEQLALFWHWSWLTDNMSQGNQYWSSYQTN